MHEQSPDEYVAALEKRFNRRKRLRALMLELALSSVMIMSPTAAHSVFDEVHKNDTLPHD